MYCQQANGNNCAFVRENHSTTWWVDVPRMCVFCIIIIATENIKKKIIQIEHSADTIPINSIRCALYSMK